MKTSVLFSIVDCFFLSLRFFVCVQSATITSVYNARTTRALSDLENNKRRKEKVGFMVRKKREKRKRHAKQRGKK